MDGCIMQGIKRGGSESTMHGGVYKGNFARDIDASQYNKQKPIGE